MSAMVVTDLDGTLLDSRSALSAGNRAALEGLGAAGVLRVVATGRSLYSARSVLDAAFPIDFLVFSSGIGVARWLDGELLAQHTMEPALALEAGTLLAELGRDFMVHHGSPDTHRFHHTAVRPGNADFARRIARYDGFGEPLRGTIPEGVCVSQLLAVEPPGEPSALERLRAALPALTVVRTTSPLDHASTWIEIFPGHVSKSQTCERLRHRCGIALEDVVAVGNDHNDDDLLAWAPRAYVVANGVEALRARHAVVSTNDADGFAEVAADVLRTMQSGASPAAGP